MPMTFRLAFSSCSMVATILGSSPSTCSRFAFSRSSAFPVSLKYSKRARTTTKGDKSGIRKRQGITPESTAPAFTRAYAW